MRWTITQVAGAVGARAGAGLDPVTPAIFPPQASRMARASCLSASKVSATTMQRLRMPSP